MTKADQAGELAKLDMIKSFGEDVHRHLFSAVVVKGNCAVIVCLANKVISNYNMFGSRMEGRILDEFDSQLVVTVQGKGILEDKWRVEFR